MGGLLTKDGADGFGGQHLALIQSRRDELLHVHLHSGMGIEVLHSGREQGGFKRLVHEQETARKRCTKARAERVTGNCAQQLCSSSH